MVVGKGRSQSCRPVALFILVDFVLAEGEEVEAHVEELVVKEDAIGAR